MKKLILGILIIGNTLVFAHEPIHQGKNKKHDFDQLKQELSLTEEQSAALLQIKEDYKGKVFAIKNDHNLDKAQKRTEIRALIKSGKAEAKEILNEEQLATLTQKFSEKAKHIQDENKRKKNGKKGKMDKEAHMQKLQKKLNLNDSQVSALNDLNSTYHNKFKELKSNESLSKEQKKNEFRNLMKQKDQEVKGILDDEQYAKYEELRSERMQEWKKKQHKKGKE